jgi:2-desacetyl-2-hydroxyethyl bacteriochlorophyllide A dehydrogenase
MKAVQLMGAGQLEVNEVPDPIIVKATDAIVKVTHSAICGADLLPYHGWTPGFEWGTIPGHEFVGEVVEVGADVATARVGARVVNTSMTSCGTCEYCRRYMPTQCVHRALFGYSGVYPRLDGGQAELVRVPLADRSLWEVPPSVTSESAVFIADILPTGFAALERGGVRSQDCVVVLGCGPVGLMAIMTAVGQARIVIAVDSIEARRDKAAELGAVSVNPDGAMQTVLASSHGMGADVVIEASGSVLALDASFSLARPRGTISVVGAHFEPNYPLNNAQMFEKELSLVFSVGNPSKDREKLMAALETGSLAPESIVSHTIPLGEAQQAYEDFDSKKALKIILTP